MKLRKTLFMSLIAVLLLAACSAAPTEDGIPGTGGTDLPGEVQTEVTGDVGTTVAGSETLTSPTDDMAVEGTSVPGDEVSTQTPDAGAMETPSASRPTDADSLVTSLEGEGLTVSETDSMDTSFVDAESRTLDVNGETVYVFTFPTASDLEAARSAVVQGLTLLPEAGNVVSEANVWTFDNVLVVYFGTDAELTGSLETVLGPQVELVQ